MLETFHSTQKCPHVTYASPKQAQPFLLSCVLLWNRINCFKETSKSNTHAPNRLICVSPCRCPMLRWLQRTSWRFTSPASPLSTSGRPTRTSAWPWPASSPSLTAPPPASSAHRPTVSTALPWHVTPADKASCQRCEIVKHMRVVFTHCKQAQRLLGMLWHIPLKNRGCSNTHE